MAVHLALSVGNKDDFSFIFELLAIRIYHMNGQNKGGDGFFALLECFQRITDTDVSNIPSPTSVLLGLIKSWSFLRCGMRILKGKELVSHEVLYWNSKNRIDVLSYILKNRYLGITIVAVTLQLVRCLCRTMS